MRAFIRSMQQSSLAKWLSNKDRSWLADLVCNARLLQEAAGLLQEAQCDDGLDAIAVPMSVNLSITRLRGLKFSSGRLPADGSQIHSLAFVGNQTIMPILPKDGHYHK